MQAFWTFLVSHRYLVVTFYFQPLHIQEASVSLTGVLSYRPSFVRTFSVRNQIIGCVLAWVTITRDSESDCPFYHVGQFRRICSGHLWCQIGSSLTNLGLKVSSGCYYTSAIVGSRVMVTDLLPYLLTIPIWGQ